MRAGAGEPPGEAAKPPGVAGAAPGGGARLQVVVLESVELQLEGERRLEVAVDPVLLEFLPSSVCEVPKRKTSVNTRWKAIKLSLVPNILCVIFTMHQFQKP